MKNIWKNAGVRKLAGILTALLVGYGAASIPGMPAPAAVEIGKQAGAAVMEIKP